MRKILALAFIIAPALALAENPWPYPTDTPYAAGDRGQMCLGVRHDADTTFVADGKYAPFQFDADGKVKVAAACTVGGYAEDSADANAETLAMAGCKRVDTAPLGTTNANGDRAVAECNARNAIWVDIDPTNGLPAGTNSIGAVTTLPTAGTITVAQVNVAASGTAVQFAAAAAKECWLSCPTANTSGCYVRMSAGNGVTGGFAVPKGAVVGPLPCTNASNFYGDAGTNDDDVTILSVN